MDSEFNSLLFKSRLQENEVNLQHLLEYEEQVCQCQTLRLLVEDLQKRHEEKDKNLIQANEVIRALRDEVQTLQQQLEQHKRKYRDDDTIGQRRQQGRRARGNDITASGCEIPPNVFLSCTSGDDPADTPTSPQELEDDSADFPASPAHDDDDDGALTTPRQLKLPVLSVKLQDCREMLGPDGVFKIQPVEDISDEDEVYNDGYKGYQDDDDSDFDPTDPSFEEPEPARDQKKPNTGVGRVKKAKAKKYLDNKRYACACGKTFSFPSHLARHQKGETKNRITATAAACENASIESTHESLSTDSPIAESDVCGKILCDKTSLKVHKRLHTGENASAESTHESASTDSSNAESQQEKDEDSNSQKTSVECDVCGKILSTKTCLEVHKRLHTGEMPYACKVCDKTFRQVGGLIKHQKRHPGEQSVKEKKHKCSVCAKEFSCSYRLRRHFGNVHSEDKPCSCSQCPKEFSCSSDLKIHCRTVHPREKPYLCSQCPKRFTTSANLKLHVAVHTNEKPFECLVCGKILKTKLSLKCHETTHTELKPFTCTFCNKSFRWKAKLKIHIRRHVGDKRHKCSLCDASFVNNCELQDHLRRHTGERPYLCAICGKTFSQRSHLKTHMIVHTGAKPHQCSVCGERFSYLQPLYDHEKKVHNIVSYPCQECGKIFKSDRGLKGHGCFQGQNSTQVNNDKGVDAAKCIDGVEAAKSDEEVEVAQHIEEVEAARCIPDMEMYGGEMT